MRISAVVLTKNSQAALKRCLKSLAWCAEIVVIDDGSTDKTQTIARQFKAKFIFHPLNNDWSATRTFALNQVKNDWVLFVDSDEFVPPNLAQEIESKLSSPALAEKGFYLHRQDILWGKTLQHGETAQVKLLRLGHRQSGRWIRPVHEIWQINGSTGILKTPLTHQRQLSLSQFLDRLNLYTSLETTTFTWIDLLKPKIKFIVNYFFHAGFLDGMAGFILAYFMSLHSLIVRVKSWEKQAH